MRKLSAREIVDTNWMGGDPRMLRSDLSMRMRVCVLHHRGSRSLHSGHLHIEPITERGTNGPCRFLERDTLHSEWRVFAVEDEATFARRQRPHQREVDHEA